jgi:hypothetical protein
MGCFFVRVHQARIAGNIRHQDRGQPSFDPLRAKEALGIGIVHPLSPIRAPYLGLCQSAKVQFLRFDLARKRRQIPRFIKELSGGPVLKM